MQIDKLLLYDDKLQLNKDKEKNLEINSNKINIRKRKKLNILCILGEAPK